MSENDEYYLAAAKHKCTKDHLFFTRYFFKQRHGIKFIVNWHHRYMADELEKVIQGETTNLLINVSPGSSKTEIVVINFIARGLALNNMARFLHLSYSDDLALLNSQIARDIIRSDEYQELWPLQIAGDTKSKKRWNVLANGRLGGGVYATSLSGQVTGFRAGHMTEGFQGAIIIDDPIKPEDALSKTKNDSANRRLLTTVKSRKANPLTPMVVIMQRVGEHDPSGFILDGGIPGDWKHIKIPALIDDAYLKTIPKKYADLADNELRDSKKRFSYWQYKEPVDDLNEMEKGGARDSEGNQISSFVFNSQWQQSPRSMGGNLIKGSMFVKYKVLPKILYRKIIADTAQKVKKHNDRSCFECWGYGEDGKIYLIDLIVGKWEAPELMSRARAFWAKHMHGDDHMTGFLREMLVEDKSSGTGLIQSINSDLKGDRGNFRIPIKGIERNIDKLTRVMDGLPYIEAGFVCVPEDAPFTNEFIEECEGFTANDTHQYDDQIDPMLDAIVDMISTKSKTKIWERLGN